MIDQRELDRDVRKLENTLSRIARIMKKDVNELMKQTAVFSLDSAIKATKPGESGRNAKLKNKYKFRKLAKIPESFGYYYQTTDGKIFKTKKPINLRKKANKGKYKRVPKGIKIWNKKRKGFTYTPYIGTKADKSDKRFKIPYAGAAKDGWKRAFRKLGDSKAVKYSNRGNKRYTSVTRRPGLLEIVNRVSYTSKTSPNTARIGLRKGTNKLTAVWMPRVDKRIERDWRRESKSFVKGIAKVL